MKNKYGVLLELPFAGHQVIKVKSNNCSLIDEASKYYKMYLKASVAEKSSESIIEINIAVKKRICEVSSNFYKNNPKTYETSWPLKLLIDIIEDCLTCVINNCTRSEWLMLHGSAVLIDETPVVLLGKTHSGKSTAILKLLNELANSCFISDDLIVLGGTNKPIIQHWSMPLHIRTSSLIYNRKFDPTQIDDNTFYISNLQCSERPFKSIDSIFIIEHIAQSENQHCLELLGIRKIQAILSNIKYYEPSIVHKVLTAFRDVTVYELCYCDDEYLISELKSKLNIKVIRNKLYTSQFMAAILREGLLTRIRIQGNSMYPYLIHNQMVHIKYREFNSLCIGEVILYEIENHFSVHRIVDIEKVNNKLLLRTKGDNNEQIDRYLIDCKAYIGVVEPEGRYRESIAKTKNSWETKM